MKASSKNPAATPSPSRGFTLMEMLISAFMLIMLLGAVLTVFERSAAIGRDQVEVSVIQQSSRIAHSEMMRHIRMAGAGGLPLTWKSLPTDPAQYVNTTHPGTFPNGFAVAITNSVPEDHKLPIGKTGATNHIVLPSSDILTLRGAFTLPVYFYYPAVETKPADATKHWKMVGSKFVPPDAVEIPNRIGKDFRISLKPLIDHLLKMKDANHQVLFLVRDLMNPDAYAVLRWVADSPQNRLAVDDCKSNEDVAGTQAAFDLGCIKVALELDPTAPYSKLMLGTALEPGAGSHNIPMTNVPRSAVAFPLEFGSIAVIQEYRYYVRADYEVAGDPTSRLSPVLTRTEYFPSTALLPLREDFIESIDVVDNLIDLQIAAGIDQDWSITAAGHGVVTDSGTNTDEILFNAADDNPANSQPPGLTRFDGRGIPAYVRWFHPKLDVYFLRLTTVAQSPRPDRAASGAGIGMIEDCNRAANFKVGAVTYNYNNERRYRRRLLQSVAELRNLK